MKYKKLLKGAFIVPMALMPIAISAGCGSKDSSSESGKTNTTTGTDTTTPGKDPNTSTTTPGKDPNTSTTTPGKDPNTGADPNPGTTTPEEPAVPEVGMKIEEIKDSTKTRTISVKNKDTGFSYADLSQQIDAVMKSWKVTVPDPAKITADYFIPPKKGDKKQLFFSYSDNGLHGKAEEGQKAWEGPLLIQIEGRNKDDLQFCAAEDPVFVNKNGKASSSSYLTIESVEAKKITLAVRFMDFKGKKVSDKAYLLTITF
ncbi:variable surface lipoprotein [Mycoplasmopsis adleri]|uniref:variable surface lipoprotein n=1 Tax=Mycoplasmopsis adleri TaxID=51362 RepID=UPI0038734949